MWIYDDLNEKIVIIEILQTQWLTFRRRMVRVGSGSCQGEKARHLVDEPVSTGALSGCVFLDGAPRSAGVFFMGSQRPTRTAGSVRLGLPLEARNSIREDYFLSTAVLLLMTRTRRENCTFTSLNNMLRKISIPNIAFVKIAAKTFAYCVLYHFSTFPIFLFYFT
jgi:hypothetical protein